ncbi:hypothetical protein ACWDT6_19690 [Nocardia grenadensis]
MKNPGNEDGPEAAPHAATRTYEQTHSRKKDPMDTTINHPDPFRPGDSVRLRTSGELLTVTELAGSTDRPTIVCRDDVPGSSLRFCQPSDLEPVALDGPTELDLIRAFEVADRDLAADRAAQARAQADIDQARAEMAEQDRLDALRAKAERFAVEVTQRAGAALEASERPVLELLEETGISIHRMAEVFDGRDCFNVSEVVVLALAIGAHASEFFGPVDAEEVAL